MLFAILTLIAGVALLLLGGDFTVRGGTGLAIRLRVPRFLIGATVIAFGTSAPELAVTLLAALQDAPGLALGNVVGSNIANLGLILGLTALLRPILFSRTSLKSEWLTVSLVMVALALFTWDGQVARWEGLLLLLGFAGTAYWTIYQAAKHRANTRDNQPLEKPSRLSLAILFTLMGLASLYFGGKLLVSGATIIAETFGVAEWVIGVVIVALGTSMPEVAASLTAALKGEGDIALGNVFGSNTFNVLLVLGTGASIRPMKVLIPIGADLLLLGGMTALVLIMLALREQLPRATGIILFASYLTYIILRVGLG
jgi:cation:H+ antiporter